MARTSGEASSSRRLDRGIRPASPELPAAISALRTTRSRPVRLTGVPAKRLRKAASSSASSSASGGTSALGQRLQLGRLRGLGELVPRAHGQAVVAAEHAVADRLRGTRREYGPCARWSGRRCSGAHRADRAPGTPSVGQTSRQRRQVPQWSTSAASGSSSAARQDGAQKQPGAELARHQVGVLALPAEPRRLAQRLFHQRRGVDEHLDLGAALARQAPATRLSPDFTTS